MYTGPGQVQNNSWGPLLFQIHKYSVHLSISRRLVSSMTLEQRRADARLRLFHQVAHGLGAVP